MRICKKEREYCMKKERKMKVRRLVIRSRKDSECFTKNRMNAKNAKKKKRSDIKKGEEKCLYVL